MTTLRFPVVLAGLALAPTLAGQTSATSDEATIEELVVVGTRRTEHSSSSLPVPVDVVDAEDLQAYGYGDTLDVLSSLTPS